MIRCANEFDFSLSLYQARLFTRQRKESLDMKIAAKCSPITKNRPRILQDIILRARMAIEINQAKLKQYYLLLNTRIAFVQVFLPPRRARLLHRAAH
jgi:hypothetical protein